jgi:hypothetical protein
MSTHDFTMGSVVFGPQNVTQLDKQNMIANFTAPVFEVVTPEIRHRLAKLDALEAAGVDNWKGYDEAMQILREQEGEGQ